MVLGAIVRRNLGEISRGYNLDEVLIVQRQDFLGDALDTRVDQVQSVFSRVHLLDNAVIHINKSLLCFLDADQHSVEHFCLVHLVRGQLDFGLRKSAGLVANTLAFFDASVYHSN